MTGILTLNVTRYAARFEEDKKGKNSLFALICTGGSGLPDDLNASFYFRPSGSRGLKEGMQFRFQGGQAVFHIEKYVSELEFLTISSQVSSMPNIGLHIEYSGDPIAFPDNPSDTNNEKRKLESVILTTAGDSIGNVSANLTDPAGFDD